MQINLLKTWTAVAAAATCVGLGVGAYHAKQIRTNRQTHPINLTASFAQWPSVDEGRYTGVFTYASLPASSPAGFAVGCGTIAGYSTGNEITFVRSAPSKHAHIVELLPKGTQLTVTGERPGWIKVVASNDSNAWVANRNITVEATL